MPRPHRIRFEDAIYHVTAHGNNEELIFREVEDRRVYLRLLARLAERAHVRVLAYGLMSNHLHLVLQTPLANVSSAVQWLHGRYAALFNRRQPRHGHLFGGRFHSTLVDTDSYLLEVTRYIHLNPVRAGLVRLPEGYPWSSYRKYIGKDDASPADPALVLDLLSKHPAGQREAYRRFAEDGAGADLPPNAPGSSDAVSATVAEVLDLLGVPRLMARSRATAAVRVAAVFLLSVSAGWSRAQIAGAFGMTPAAVSTVLWRMRVKMARHDDFRRELLAAGQTLRAILKSDSGSR